MALEKIVRKLIREYYGITAGATPTTTYHYINTGFTKLTEENNPQVDKTPYIGDSNATSTVTGYENAWAFESEYVKGDTVVDDLASIALNQKTGSDCERKIVSVQFHEPVSGSDNTYKARMANVTVEATPPTGDPKAVTKLTGSIHQNGDLVFGTFNTETNTFTADSAE